MPDSLNVRIGKALTKLGIPYQDVSDPEDVDVSTAYYAEALDGQGPGIPLVVSVSKQKANVWVQAGVSPAGISDGDSESAVAAIADYDASVQRAPGSLFSQFRLPKFRARGFVANVSWSKGRRRVVSTVVIPAREFSSATLDASIHLATYLTTQAITTLAAASQNES